MKYFEQKEPHCLIKAKTKQSAFLIYADEVMSGTLKEQLVFELLEVSEKEAYKSFEKSVDFDGNPLSKGNIDFDFYSNTEMILVVSRDLLSEGAEIALMQDR